MGNADPRSILLRLAAEHGASLSALSLMIGRNGTYLQQFVRKGSPRRLAEADRRSLARFFGVDEAELGGLEETSSISDRKNTSPDWIDVPRLPHNASAGPGALAGDEEPFGAFRFAARWLRGQGLDPAMLSTIAVRGDSMEPTLRDGDEILVDETPRPLRDGIHVVRLDDALLVKRIDTARAGVVQLVSDNRAYSVIEVPPGEVVVIGRVVWKCGRV